MKANDGGPAFPVPPYGTGDPRYGMTQSHDGMSLRDWFAGQALAGLMAGYQSGPMGIYACAQVAIETADAMIRARERGQEADGDEAWFAKQPNACVSVADDVVMASSGRHYLASGSTRAAAIRALRAKVEGSAQ